MVGITTDVLNHNPMLVFHGTVNIRFYNSYSGFTIIPVYCVGFPTQHLYECNKSKMEPDLHTRHYFINQYKN